MINWICQATQLILLFKFTLISLLLFPVISILLPVVSIQVLFPVVLYTPLLICLVVLIYLNLTVNAFFYVQHSDFFFSVFVDWSENEVFEVVEGTAFYAHFDVGVLAEDVVVQERSCKSKADGQFEGYVDEMTVRLVDDVVVAEHLSSSLLLTHDCLLLWDSVGEQRKSDAYKAFCYKIHFCNFLIFIVNYLVVIRILKPSWQEASCNIILKTNVFKWFRIEKSLIFSE